MSVLLRTFECLTCGANDCHASKSAKLAYGHRMCHHCPKRIFTMPVKDQAHMPPRCCTSRYILLEHVEHLFDVNSKLLWNRKYQEYKTKDQVYCQREPVGNVPNHATFTRNKDVSTSDVEGAGRKNVCCATESGTSCKSVQKTKKRLS